MKSTTAAGTLAAVLIGGALTAGCSSTGTATAATGSAARAAATSTAAVQAETDAKAYFGKCWPASAAGQVRLATSLGTASGRQALLECAGVPKADRSAAEACALSNVEHGGTLPKGLEAKAGALLTDVYPCAARYRSGGSRTPPASPPASAK